jgi:hypothetical protein
LDEKGFYFIGFFELDNPPIVYCQDAKNNPAFKNNAHCRREGDSAKILKGSPNSMKFKKAVPFGKALTSRILLTSNGKPLKFDRIDKKGRVRSDFAEINSASRASRLIEGREQRLILEEAVKKLNPSIKI